MSNRLDELLSALPAPALDHRLSQLEPLVWRRIEARPAMDWNPGRALSFQLAAAGMALVIGLAVGWSMNARHDPDTGLSLYSSYAEVGPAGRLENGL